MMIEGESVEVKIDHLIDELIGDDENDSTARLREAWARARDLIACHELREIVLDESLRALGRAR